jgi:hypothetical protein
MDFLVVLLLFVSSLAAGVVVNLISSDLYDRCHGFSRRLIKRPLPDCLTTCERDTMRSGARILMNCRVNLPRFGMPSGASSVHWPLPTP